MLYAHRLQNQRLSQPGFRRPVDVVRCWGPSKRGIALADRHLKKEMVQEKVYWGPRSQTLRDSKPSAHLIPAFDEYFVAYKDRESALLGPTVIVDGKVAGTWKSTNGKNSVTIALKLARLLKKPETLAITKQQSDTPTSWAYLRNPFRVTATAFRD